ncbi:MAG TPA: hypothetical protein VI911_10840 [Patescibacteria group bacterium]|nr:hypothetical protein [Patescibacteria group bacterium]
MKFTSLILLVMVYNVFSIHDTLTFQHFIQMTGRCNNDGVSLDSNQGSVGIADSNVLDITIKTYIYYNTLNTTIVERNSTLFVKDSINDSILQHNIMLIRKGFTRYIKNQNNVVGKLFVLETINSDTSGIDFIRTTIIERWTNIDDTLNTTKEHSIPARHYNTKTYSMLYYYDILGRKSTIKPNGLYFTKNKRVVIKTK